MNAPIIKIEKDLAEALGFPEEISVNFLKNYTFNKKYSYLTSNDTISYSIEEKRIDLKEIHENLVEIYELNRTYKIRKFTVTKEDDILRIIVPSKIYDINYINYSRLNFLIDSLESHYRHTDYKAYGESYKIKNDPHSKDFKEIIVNKLREKILYHLNKLYTEFASKKKIIHNNLLELYEIDVSNLNVNVEDYIVKDKEPIVKKFNVNKLESYFERHSSIEELYEELQNKHCHCAKNFIYILNCISKIEKIVTFSQLIFDLNINDSFGPVKMRMIYESGLPF